MGRFHHNRKKRGKSLGQGSDLRRRIIRQVEYYFNEHSYANDKHLRRLASSSPLEGFVPIKEIMKFNRIKSMCTEKEEIVKALHLSSKLEIDCTNEYIRAVRHPRTSIKEEESPAHSTNTDDTKPILPLNIIVPEQILPNLLSFNSYHFVRPFLPVEAPQTRATEIRKEEAIPVYQAESVAEQPPTIAGGVHIPNNHQFRVNCKSPPSSLNSAIKCDPHVSASALRPDIKVLDLHELCLYKQAKYGKEAAYEIMLLEDKLQDLFDARFEEHSLPEKLRKSTSITYWPVTPVK